MCATKRLTLLGLLVCLAVFRAPAAQSVHATVYGIPSTATRLVGLLDGGGITSPSPFAKNISTGTVSTVIDIGTVAGGPYRLRILAQGPEASLLSSGKISGINVPAGSTVNVGITLASILVSVNGSTPTSTVAGGPATVLVDLYDAGDVVWPVASSCWTDWSTDSASLSNRKFGNLAKVSDANYQCNVVWSAPSNAPLIYYRFGTYAYEFTYDGVTPILLYPSGTPRSISLVTASTINLTVSDIPSTAARVVLSVEGGSLTAASISAQSISAGTPSVLILLAVPAGGPYRVRAVAHDSSSQLLRTGATTGVVTNSGGSVAAGIAMADVSAAVDPSTPPVATYGSAITIADNFTDTGFIFRTGDAQCWVDFGTASAALTSRRYGAITNVSGSQFKCSVSLTAPTTGTTLYYRMSAYSYDLQYEHITPLLSWPTTARTIPLASAGSISLTISNIPASDTRLVIAVDGGAIMQPSLTPLNIASGTISTSTTINVGAGGPYRVRIISHAAGGQVRRSGKATAITVSGGGSAAASVALADLVVSLDSTTPSVAAPGTSVALLFNLIDTGDVLNVGAGYCWVNYGENALGLLNRAFSALAVTGGAGYRCAVALTLPNNAPGMYYEFQTAFSNFIVAGSIPLITWPSGGPLQLAMQTSVTVTTNPLGLVMTVDGAACTSPRTFAWTPGSAHTIAAADQDISGTLYLFQNWSDGGATAHSITTPAAAQTVTANFNTASLDLHLENITLSIGVGLYQAINSINAENGFSAEGSATVTFKAGNYIRLGPGFRATAGSAGTTFNAVIDLQVN